MDNLKVFKIKGNRIGKLKIKKYFVPIDNGWLVV